MELTNTILSDGDVALEVAVLDDGPTCDGHAHSDVGIRYDGFGRNSFLLNKRVLNG
jgi:hypothetical protein